MKGGYLDECTKKESREKSEVSSSEKERGREEERNKRQMVKYDRNGQIYTHG